ncbi:MAG: glycosyltransferase family 39 protein [Candidatus Daviesbacteria bacterium]|nr:MAG: glycosyltransferase family 39 protein [Candidatus Daviesbacteria bacterium]
MKYLFLIFILILHILVLNQLTFTAWPEMLSYPYLLSNNFFFYKDFVMPYPPGLVLILSAVYHLFEFSPLVLKYFTWIYILVGDLLIFLIIKKLTNNLKLSFLLTFLYILLQSVLDGNMMWFEIGMLPFLLLEFLMVLAWLEKKRPIYLFWGALFLSFSILVKQTAVLYSLPLLFILIKNRELNYKNILYLIYGGAPLIGFIVYLVVNNSLMDFTNWNIYYPINFWSKFPGYTGFQISRREFLTIMILGLTIFTCLFIEKLCLLNKKVLKNQTLILSLIFFVISTLIIYPRLTFFHLQPALVFLIISLSLIIHHLTKFKIITLLLVSTIFLVVAGIYYQPKKEAIRFYGPEEIAWANFLNQNLGSSEKVYLLGLNSSLYVYSDRLPPKGWLDNFGWYFEIPGVQDKFIKDLTADPPKLILRKIPASGNWFDLNVYQPQKVVEYIKLNYTKMKGTFFPSEIKQMGEVELWQRK